MKLNIYTVTVDCNKPYYDAVLETDDSIFLGAAGTTKADAFFRLKELVQTKLIDAPDDYMVNEAMDAIIEFKDTKLNNILITYYPTSKEYTAAISDGTDFYPIHTSHFPTKAEAINALKEEIDQHVKDCKNEMRFLEEAAVIYEHFEDVKITCNTISN